MNTTSGIPGTLKDGVTPEDIQREIEKLQKQVAPLLSQTQLQPVTIKSNNKPKCFVIMPFNNEDLEVVFNDFVLPVLRDNCMLECHRGDDIFGSNSIISDINKSIKQTDIAIADLTGKNPNVFYELGICHTLDKPVLMLAQSKDDIPFDVRHLRVLLYDYTPRGCKKLEQDLQQHIDALVERA